MSTMSISHRNLGARPGLSRSVSHRITRPKAALGDHEERQGSTSTCRPPRRKPVARHTSLHSGLQRASLHRKPVVEKIEKTNDGLNDSSFHSLPSPTLRARRTVDASMDEGLHDSFQSLHCGSLHEHKSRRKPKKKETDLHDSFRSLSSSASHINDPGVVYFGNPDDRRPAVMFAESFHRSIAAESGSVSSISDNDEGGDDDGSISDVSFFEDLDLSGSIDKGLESSKSSLTETTSSMSIESRSSSRPGVIRSHSARAMILGPLSSLRRKLGRAHPSNENDVDDEEDSLGSEFEFHELRC